MADEAGAQSARMTYRHWPALRAMLIAEPQLVSGDAELLAALNLRPAAANLVEFGPAALARLETARAREADARAEMQALAQANHAAQTAAHASVVDLLDARDPADLAARVDAAARDRFGLAAGVLALEGTAPEGWRPLPRGFTAHILGEAAMRLGPPVAAEPLFGPRAAGVRSTALVRLDYGAEARPGVLAFGAPEADGFSEDMGGELIAFLARMVERAAQRWAGAPAAA